MRFVVLSTRIAGRVRHGGVPRIPRPMDFRGGVPELRPKVGGTVRAYFLSGFRGVLLVRREPLAHFMPAEGLSRRLS